MLFDDQVSIFALEYLDLSYNNAELNQLQIPGPALARLKYLYLFRAGLSDIRFTAPLINLDTLHLAENKLTEITLPKTWPQLVTLYLHQNQLETFTLNPKLFEKLEYLSLKENPIKNLESEDLQEQNCWTRIKPFFEKGFTLGWEINNTGKIIFLGNSNVGKSTIIERITTGKLNKNMDSTHGIQIYTWNIPKKDYRTPLIHQIDEYRKEYSGKHNVRLEIPKEIKLQVWDFGGQEYYHATHRLFFSKNALYIILWDEESNRYSSNNNIPDNYPQEHWINNVLYYNRPKSKIDDILLVQNKVINKGKFNIDNKIFIIYDYNNPALFDGTLGQLEDYLRNNLHKINGLGIPYLQIYFDIRTKIETINKETKYYKFNDFVNFLKIEVQNSGNPDLFENEEEVYEIIEFLETSGLIIFYEIDKKIPDKNYIFTDSDWLTKLIYEILSLKVKNLGHPGEFDLVHLLTVIDTKSLRSIGLNEPEFWIKLLKDFDLIFETKRNNERVFIAPQYLPATWNDEQVKIKNSLENKISGNAVTIHYPNFLPPVYLNSLISQFGEYHYEYMYCKEGIIVKETNNNIAIISGDVKEKKITISLSGDYKALISKILSTLEIIMKNDGINDPDFNIEIDDYPKEKISYQYLKLQLKSQNDNISYIKYWLKLNMKMKQIFIAYPRSSQKNVMKLRDDLGARFKKDLIFWCDQMIPIGSKWEDKIYENIDLSIGSLLMIDSDFINSDYIIENELPKIKEKDETGHHKIICIEIRELSTNNLPKDLQKIQRFSPKYWEFDIDDPFIKDETVPLEQFLENGGRFYGNNLQWNRYLNRLEVEIRRTIDLV